MSADSTTRIRGQINRGLGWIGLASSLVGVLDMVAIVIILSRYVSPAEYGIAASAVWLFPVLDLTTDLGLSAAVIQRDDHTVAKISTVFWLNLLMSLAIFGVLWALAAPMSAFYGHAIVGAMVVAYGTKLIGQNVYFIPMAMMRRELRYRELSLIRIVANVAEFTGKVGAAAAGYGIWCFVVGPLCRVAVTGVGVQLRHPWRPRGIFRPREAVDYLVFGVKASASKLLFQLYSNIDYPIVGFFFGETALGVYKAAYELVLEPVRIISDVIVQVAFPAFARLRAHREALIEQFVSFTRMNLVTVMSFLAFVFVVPEELILVSVGPEFLAAVPAARILCSVGVLRALGYVVPPLLDGAGYAGRTLLYQSVAAVALPALYVVFAMTLGDALGFRAVALAWAVGYPIAFVVLVLLALWLLELRARDYLRRVIGIPLCVGVAVGLGFGARFALMDAAAGVRVVAVGAAMLAALGLLLAYTQGISPRTIKRALG